MANPWFEDEDWEDKDMEARTRPENFSDFEYPADVNCYHQQDPGWAPGDDPDDRWLF